MFKFINRLFTIKGYCLECEENCLIEDEEQEDENILKLISILEEKGLNVITENASIEDNLENLFNFSFMSIEGSTQYADDYEYYTHNQDDNVTIVYNDYLTMVTFLYDNENETYIIRESGFTTEIEDLLINFNQLLKLIESSKWDNTSF